MKRKNWHCGGESINYFVNGKIDENWTNMDVLGLLNSLEWFPRLDRRGSYLEEMTIEGGAIMQINRSQVLH